MGASRSIFSGPHLGLVKDGRSNPDSSNNNLFLKNKKTSHVPSSQSPVRRSKEEAHTHFTD